MKDSTLLSFLAETDRTISQVLQGLMVGAARQGPAGSVSTIGHGPSHLCGRCDAPRGPGALLKASRPQSGGACVSAMAGSPEAGTDRKGARGLATPDRPPSAAPEAAQRFTLPPGLRQSHCRVAPLVMKKKCSCSRASGVGLASLAVFAPTPPRDTAMGGDMPPLPIGGALTGLPMDRPHHQPESAAPATRQAMRRHPPRRGERG